MTKESINNPFNPSPEAPTHLSALAEQGFLPPEEVAKLKELEGQKNRSSEFGIRSSLSDISLEEGYTAEERNKKESQETIREGIIVWARVFELGDDLWVDQYFEFNDDGTAVCIYSLNLQNKGITYFPKGITEVQGDLKLSGNKIKKLDNMPSVIDGDLDLSNNPLSEILAMPAYVDGDLYLSDIAATSILGGSSSIEVMGFTWVSSKQKDLIASLKGHDLQFT